MKGKIKFFDDKRGYGFIITQDDTDLFFHFTGILKHGFKTLNTDDQVEFDMSKNQKGACAINIKVLSPSPSIF